MAATPTPEVGDITSLLPKVPPLHNTMGVVLLCTCFGCMLYGLTTHQTYRYFRLYPTDGWRLKAFVALLLFFDTFHSVLSIHICYFYLIDNYFNPLRLLVGVWSIRLGVMQTGCVIISAHCFYARRMLLLSGGRLWPFVFIVCCLVLEFGLCIGATTEAFIQLSFSDFKHFTWLVCSALGVAVLVDIFVTIGLMYYLHRSRTGFKRTDSLLDILIVYSINTGLCTSIITLGASITAIAMPGNLIYSGLYIIASKMYTNSVLAVLNSRRSLVDRGMEGFETGSFGLKVVEPGDVQAITFKTPSSQMVAPAQTLSIDVRVTREILVDDESAHNSDRDV
ncbi:hypothetical protein FKP32DRAFT_1681942 [Trametes sanguinea]|nr:hypothetical protein FKP32DRAFT_1681942 [Trametes sanguinea]